MDYRYFWTGIGVAVASAAASAGCMAVTDYLPFSFVGGWFFCLGIFFMAFAVSAVVTGCKLSKEAEQKERGNEGE